MVENWINTAKVLIDKPKTAPKKRPKEEPQEEPSSEIPMIPDYKPFEKFEQDYGEYGPEYWNSKWEKAPIIYTGRALRGESYKKQIDADVKCFINDDDAILWHVITQLGLRKETANATAQAIQSFVTSFLQYTYDDLSSDCPEFWQFPFESIQSEIGDCIANYEEIYTEEGIKKVGDLIIGDKVLSYDFERKEFCYKPIIKIWEKRKLEIYRVLFRNGQTIDVSKNHPFWIRQTQQQSVYEKTYLSNIELSKWWKRKTPIAKKVPYKIKDIEWLARDLCFVLGHYLAEGWKEHGKIISSGYELNDEIIPIFEQYDNPYTEYTNSAGVSCVTILKSPFKSFLSTIKENSHNVTIPEEIFHLPPDKLQALINGFCFGDDHRVNYLDKRGYEANKQEVMSTSSERLAKDIQRIGLQLGKSFHIWKHVNHKGFGNKPIYRITFNPRSHFLKDFGYPDLSEVSIREYNKTGTVNMRDFEVADTNSYVFKNGIIGHNCEDGAILIASLLINAGIPSWRVKVCAAQVFADPIFAPSDTELGGHAYCIYLADRPDSDRKLEWVILDWTYLPDSDVPIEDKPLAKDGGQEGAYREIWFTFNDKYSWAQNSIEVIKGRISKNRQMSKDEVIAPMKDIMKSIADEELKKMFRKYGIIIE